jgi:hypothetical protein
MAAMCTRVHARPLLLSLALATLGCITNPEGVERVTVSPSALTFASIRAPAQLLTVTVEGKDGKIRSDAHVTWTYWVSQWAPLVESNNVVSIERESATTWRVRPVGTMGGVFVYANVEGRRSAPLSAVVLAGPPVALAMEQQFAVSGRSGVPIPMYTWVQALDADGFRANSQLPITVSIATGNGTLSGPTTVNASGGLAGFVDLVINGTGEFTLRFTSPGLTPSVSNPITVTTP